MKTTMTVTLLCLLLSSIHVNAQTIYGIHGLVKTPDAYTIENGMANLGAGVFRDEYYKFQPGLLHTQWGITGNFGFHSRFDIGFRITGTPDISDIDTNHNYRYVIDRSLNAKFIILREHKGLPQLAVGWQDVTGTRFFNSTYVTISKKWKLAKPLTLETNAGYGFDLFKNKASNHRYTGAFGGIELSHTYFYLTGEYIDENNELCGGVGVKYKDVIRLRIISTNSFKETGGQLSFTFKI